MRIVILFVALGAVCLAAQPPSPPAGQGQQPPTFTTGNRTVAVYTTVKEIGGRLVPDLDRDVFELSDNGKKQELTLFANDVQPITVVILLDRSGSMKQKFTVVERAAEAFVGAMGAADKARIGSFSQRVQIDPIDFTSTHDELLKVLRNDLQEEGPTPPCNAINKGIYALMMVRVRRGILVFTDGVDSPMNCISNN